ncbi:MAG: hypothetical protein MJ025_00535 [Victivallaceae bacterium]|nr:hypothetical protein [Victivallaceae bacterium]
MSRGSISGLSLESAVRGALEVESRRCTLDEYLDGVDESYRRIVTHLLLSYFRRKKLVDATIADLLTKRTPPEVVALLRIALARVLFQDKIAPESSVNIAVEVAKKQHCDRLVNAVLRNAMRRDLAVSDKPKDVLPDMVLKCWKRRFDEKTLADICECFLSGAGLTFRFEHSGEPPSELEATPVDAYGGFRFFETKKAANCIGSHDVYIQDPAASLAVSLIDFGDVCSALDLCAAPGGKSLMISERLNPCATLVAADVSDKRQKLTRENFEKRHLPHKVITAEAGEISGCFDLVLADVPCSNTGVFRRRPDALWRFSERSLADVMKIQRKILDDASRLVAPGGQLVYSTCSIEPDENTTMVERFLETHPDFELARQELLIPAMDHDGAGAALLKRNGGKRK